MYVGSNWQRWEQVRRFLEGYAPGPREGRPGMPGRLGLGRAAGLGRARRASWGSTPIPAFLAELGVEVRDGVRFDEVVGLLGKARFAPVFHRPSVPALGLRDEPDVRDLLCRHSAGADAAAGFRVGGLRPRGADAGARRRRGRAPGGCAAAAGALLGRGAADARAPGPASLLCPAVPGTRQRSSRTARRSGGSR